MKGSNTTELASLNKSKLFTEAIPTPPKVFHVEFKRVFLHKQNENNKVVRYKAKVVEEQGFTQRPDIDFNETYSLVMSGTTFCYLLSLAVQNRLSMQLMDAMTTYLYDHRIQTYT
jgi:hypothetical protein